MAKAPAKSPKQPIVNRLPKRFVPRFWQMTDQRGAVVREVKRRMDRLKEECGADSFAKELLVQEVVFLSVLLETDKVKMFETGELDRGAYVQAVNAYQGLLKTLGLEKKVKKAGGLAAYLGNDDDDEATD